MRIPALAIIALVAAPGCALYFGTGDDDVVDGAWPAADADERDGGPVPDAADPTVCDAEIACPAPSANRMSICGRLVDVETGAPVTAPDAGGQRCASPLQGGPCMLGVWPVDAGQLADDPSAIRPLPVAGYLLDTCGRFALRDVSVGNAAMVGLVVDEQQGVPDQVAMSVLARPALPGQTARRTAAPVVRHVTDRAWSSAAGLGGTTFVGEGALLITYHAMPATGVQVTRDGATLRSPPSYFFADAGPTRASLAPGATATGANGSALVGRGAGTGVAAYSGTGGPPGCTWPSRPAAILPGILMVLALECP
jgi:hypothetical protein